MEHDSWRKLDKVFFEALELPPEQRQAFLDRACGDDAALKREVEAVLRGHAAAGGTGDRERLLSPTSLQRAPGLAQGTRVGAWALEAVIGRGGMGEVYRAYRADAQYEQRVAVKLMRTGRDTAELMQRFRTERQILARLAHPNIATLLDGGVTDGGQPYLVMQYVDGVPITSFANDHTLGLNERLRLFLTVCDAVQFAHVNLVVHRDLKPGNILVTGEGDVRLLDFGIAKLLDPESTERSTTGDLLLLTPEHAAPEQFLGDPITTATDVYALGVLLYELLTGRRPFQHVPAVELHRAVVEQEPQRPSVAAQGEPRPPVAVPRISGDLDSIVLKALRKEPARRYTTVMDLADDVRRHLNGFPVTARPETLRYVASRYLKRHRVGVLTATALVVALLSLAVVSVRAAVTSRAQARAIARERDVAVAVSSFLENLFKAPDPFAVGPARRDTLRIREFLAEGAAKVRRDLSGQPLVMAQMLTVLGRAQTELGQFEPARALLDEAVTVRRRELGPAAPLTAHSERALGSAILLGGKPAVAESVFRAAIPTLARDSIQSAGEWYEALSGLGNALLGQGRYPEAEEVYRQALIVPVDSSKGTNEAGRLSQLANALARQAKYPEAESLHRRSVALERAAQGNDHPLVAIKLRNLALMLSRKGDAAAAEPLNREALAIYRARLPANHPRTAQAINSLGTALAEQQKFAEAESLFREGLAMQRAIFGEQSRDVGASLLNLASVLGDQGREAEALKAKEEARAVLIAVMGANHPDIAVAHNNVGVSLRALGRHAAALEAFGMAYAIRRDRLGEAHPLTIDAVRRTADCLIDLRRFREAELRLTSAYATFQPHKDTDPQVWDELLDGLVRAYRASGRSDEANRYQAMRAPKGS